MKFRVFHVLEIIKFLIFWVLIETLVEKKKSNDKSPSKNFEIEFENLDESKEIHDKRLEEDILVRRYRSDNILTH
jgi:hypothetical protein